MDAGANFPWGLGTGHSQGCSLASMWTAWPGLWPQNAREQSPDMAVLRPGALEHCQKRSASRLQLQDLNP